MHTYHRFFNEPTDCIKTKLKQVLQPVDNLAWHSMIEMRIAAKRIHIHEPYLLPGNF